MNTVQTGTPEKAATTLMQAAVEQYRISGRYGEKAAADITAGFNALAATQSIDDSLSAQFHAAVAEERRATECDEPLPPDTLYGSTDEDRQNAVLWLKAAAEQTNNAERSAQARCAAAYLTDYWDLSETEKRA